ncbi:MAG: Bifunctional protein Aas [Nitrospirae bacterium]|nr:MAG: putative acyltransferase [Nitrospira sp. OLB3]MBV6470015.1 Bifunctional protein Aas [Nitrospirota bacterium]MCE7964578.1 1-acyl-sn-glycerol-3-phosphate acyltransferase [Nitrospira sp. NTP2]MCK6493770.1 1-acyl-sn-glycerol-3-phosphate acyltransferase [Nitrospira sp.]MEB2338326.1 lysophospholipid acyltransferase family protein [Nitrospirales bacterium]
MSVLYGFLWVLSRVIGWICFRYRTVGTVPRDGGVLIASNHASYLDIPLLGCGVPRRVWYMGRHDLFPIPLLNGLLQGVGWIPLRVGRLDRDAFSKAVRLIQAGKAVAIFPEGGRTVTGSLKPGKPGIGVIVSQTGCRVVPAHIDGTFEVLPPGATWPRFRRVTVSYGEPIDFAAAAAQMDGKAFYQHVSQTVMAKIAELGQVPVPGDRPVPTEPPRDLAATHQAKSCNAE